MSRISRGYLPGGRNAPAGAAPVPSALLRRGRALAGVPSGEGEEILDLFSRTRRGYSISSSFESDALNRMEKKVSVGLDKAGRGAAEDFLSLEIGKHDYDWLLTPPGTPLFSSMDSTDRKRPTTSQRSSSNLRSASLVKPSRLSLPQPENSRMARSSSTTRASFSNSSRTPSSVLNTSTASVNSRPTTPGNRTRTPSAAAAPRPATSRSITPARTRPIAITAAAPRPATSRSITPARTRPIAITTPAAEKPKPTAQISRPSTPTTRAHFPAYSTTSSGPNSIHARPSSRPSTPTHLPPPTTHNSRPSSPARSRTTAQPIVSPDFPVDAPPNLRTKLPEIPVSAGRQRPGIELTVRGNLNVDVLGSGASSSRRASSPAVARGRVADNQAKCRVNGYRDGLKLAENQKSVVPEKKPVKPSPGGETGGYGRTMSKNSLSMAIKHMDIRQSISGMRSGASLFPHSVRSTPVVAAAGGKDRPASLSEPPPHTHKNRITDHANYSNELMPKDCENEELKSTQPEFRLVKTIDMKVVYASSRHGSILLKEDARSLNWLQRLDEKKSDETAHLLFDRRFDPLPEPFILM